jgi:predicted TIM-barrel fold metal-dependent hydrolase
MVGSTTTMPRNRCEVLAQRGDEAAVVGAEEASCTHRGCTVVVDHFGRPDSKLGVDDPGFQYLLSAADTGRLHVKLSAAYRNGAKGRGEEVALQAAPLLKRAFGLERLLWGSDWPHKLYEKDTRYEEQRRFLDRLLPEAKERDIVLAQAPRRIFRLAGR